MSADGEVFDFRRGDTREVVVHPSDIEAELCVIGAALADNEAVHLAGPLEPRQFYDPVNARIWAAIAECIAKGVRADPVTVSDRLGADPGFEEQGGRRFLLDVWDKAPPAASTEAHAAIIIDRSLRRELIRVAEDAARAARLDNADAIEQLGRTERSLAELARSSDSRSMAVAIGLDALETMEAAWRGERAGVPVGLDAIDRVTGGIRQDDVWIIAGRTSMAKSVMGVTLGRGIAQRGRGVLMFSLEMPKDEVQARLAADLAYDPECRWDGMYGGNIEYGDILKGKGRPELRDKAREAARRMVDLPFSIIDVGGLTIDDIRSQALRQMRAWEKAGTKPGCIIIDHLGLVRPVRKTDNKAADTADVVNELKSIAKQIGAPVIALAQVNRQTESRNDKRPTLADLNWSGAIEQIADFVCLLYRESYYLERSSADGDWDRAQACKHDLDLLIQKNRKGPICNVKAFVDVACNAIRDLPDRDPQFNSGAR